jgi:hypothetical protein
VLALREVRIPGEKTVHVDFDARVAPPGVGRRRDPPFAKLVGDGAGDALVGAQLG